MIIPGWLRTCEECAICGSVCHLSSVLVGRLEADSLDMTETPSQGTLRMRRASNASSDNLEKEDKKSVLVMAAKHRVVERGKKFVGSTVAEAKALAALADENEEESKADPSSIKPPTPT